MDTAAPDAAFDGADGSRFVRRSGAWNDHDARCVASFMDAARASGFSSVQVLYGELKLKAFACSNQLGRNPVRSSLRGHRCSSRA